MSRFNIIGRSFAASLILFAAVNTVSAKDLNIKAFAGLWQGSALSENDNSENFSLTQRDLDVEVRPNSDNSFVLTWRTVLRQKGDPDAPTEILKTTSRRFVPSASKSVWNADNASDPLNGGTTSWAKVKGQKLSVYSMAVTENGSYDMLIYDRTLSGLGMTLEFTAIRDGKIRRTAKGTLVRTGK